MSDLIERALRVCGGNPGALTVVGSLLRDNLVVAAMLVEVCEHHKLHGSEIWEMWKDACHEKMEVFSRHIKLRHLKVLQVFE